MVQLAVPKAERPPRDTYIGLKRSWTDRKGTNEAAFQLTGLEAFLLGALGLLAWSVLPKPEPKPPPEDIVTDTRDEILELRKKLKEERKSLECFQLQQLYLSLRGSEDTRDVRRAAGILASANAKGCPWASEIGVPEGPLSAPLAFALMVTPSIAEVISGEAGPLPGGLPPRFEVFPV